MTKFRSCHVAVILIQVVRLSLPSTTFQWMASAQAILETTIDESAMPIVDHDDEDDDHLSWNQVCTQETTIGLPFCNSSLDVEDRVEDYTRRIPVEQQIDMMLNTAASYPPLYIPAYQWWSEGLHGPLQSCLEVDTGDAKKCVCPTSFPCPSALGTSFNRTLFHLIGVAVGAEGRAIFNIKKKNNDTLATIGDGVTYWSPTINLQRDPRWGRNQEVPGEDPVLTSNYAIDFVHGLQQQQLQDPASNSNKTNGVQIAAACKHFVANSLESWNNSTRHNFNARISKEDLYNYYFPPFQACVQEANAIGVMCSYNALNGEPTCMNDWLLRDVLRNEWNFTGYIVSDCGALYDIDHGHHAAVDATQASALALNATVDVNCGNGDYYPKGLRQALDEGWVEEWTIRASFRRLARVQMKLELFDQQEDSKTGQDDWKVIDSPSHHHLAYEAALQSIVVLQNQFQTLPLNRTAIKTVAVIGPHLHAQEVLLSNYHGERCGCGSSKNYSCIQTPFQAIQSAHPSATTIGKLGCKVTGNEVNEIEGAVDLAKKSDAVILLVGIDQSQESEGKDRYETTLPGLQTKLVSAVLQAKQSNVVLVLFNGGAMSLGQELLTTTPAIVDAFYGGQEASRALASVLFGDYNPTGKLAATMYPPYYVHEMPMTEMGLTVGIGRTHLHYKGTPEFEFGHGLSYSQWQLDYVTSADKQQLLLHDPQSNGDRSNVTVQFQLSNLGPYPSSQTVLLFWRPPKNTRHGNSMLRQKLHDFKGTTCALQPGETENVTFSISWEDLAVFNEVEDSSVVHLGLYELEARTSNKVSARTSVNVVSWNVDSSFLGLTI